MNYIEPVQRDVGEASCCDFMYVLPASSFKVSVSYVGDK